MVKHLIPLVAVMASIAVVAIAFTFLTGHTVAAQSSPELAQFTALSHATSDQCAYLGDKAAIYSSVDSEMNNTYYQGSCCSPMDYNHYAQQIAGLKNYSSISAVPQNPYNVSVGQIKQMLGYYGD